MNVLKVVGLTLLGFVLVVASAVGFGFLNLGFTGFFGPRQAAVQQEVWQNSSPHVQSVEQDLAKEQLELAKTTDPQARSAIIAYLQTECAGVDPNTISNPQLRYFMEQVMSGQLH